MTKSHKENGIDCVVEEESNKYKGIMAIKRNMPQGFELFLLMVNKANRNRGISHKLIQECVAITTKENYRCIDCFVVTDNKNMLRLQIKNSFMPLEMQYHPRADGMDLLKLRRYIN